MINARNFNLKNMNSNLPNMSNTIRGWFLDITLEVVDRVMVGADFVEQVIAVINTKGVVQPAKSEDLAILAEGTRSWEYMTLHCLPNVDLKPNQFIRYDGVKYKILTRRNYQKYGYIEYMICEGFE